MQQIVLRGREIPPTGDQSKGCAPPGPWGLLYSAEGRTLLEQRYREYEARLRAEYEAGQRGACPCGLGCMSAIKCVYFTFVYFSLCFFPPDLQNKFPLFFRFFFLDECSRMFFCVRFFG